MQAEGFDRSDLTHLSSFLVHHSGFEHNKRCLLAYVRHRMKKVEQLRWEVGRVIPLDVKQNLSTDEQEHFKKYSASLESYMKECGFDLMANLSPPKEPFVEVRVLESCGEIYTDDGAAVKLEQNTTHYLRRTDVEQLVRQGYLEQTSWVSWLLGSDELDYLSTSWFKFEGMKSFV